MSFRSWDNSHLARFNSQTSSQFLDQYEAFVDTQLKEEAAKKSHRTFAASSFRCDRLSWFRLRGVDPDVPKSIDQVLQFTADIGTACHKLIQNNLRTMLCDDWIDVKQYIKDSMQIDSDKIELVQDNDGLETLVDIKDPPFRFACDGIIRLNGEFYLLEIKSSEYSSWDELTDPKPQHIDQVKCYCTLLNLDKVLFVYIDRQYGGLKCFEFAVTAQDKECIKSRIQHVQDMVKYNLAPEPLPKGDSWCNPNHCPYYKKCEEYGR